MGYIAHFSMIGIVQSGVKKIAGRVFVHAGWLTRVAGNGAGRRSTPILAVLNVVALAAVLHIVRGAVLSGLVFARHIWEFSTQVACFPAHLLYSIVLAVYVFTLAVIFRVRAAWSVAYVVGWEVNPTSALGIISGGGRGNSRQAGW